MDKTEIKANFARKHSKGPGYNSSNKSDRNLFPNLVGGRNLSSTADISPFFGDELGPQYDWLIAKDLYIFLYVAKWFKSSMNAAILLIIIDLRFYWDDIFQ